MILFRRPGQEGLPGDKGDKGNQGQIGLPGLTGSRGTLKNKFFANFLQIDCNHEIT